MVIDNMTSCTTLHDFFCEVIPYAVSILPGYDRPIGDVLCPVCGNSTDSSVCSKTFDGTLKIRDVEVLVPYLQLGKVLDSFPYLFLDLNKNIAKCFDTDFKFVVVPSSDEV